MFVFLLISCFLAAETSAQNVFCPVANGNVPNPASEGCVTFFRCINHLPILLRCPRGEQFHFTENKCMKGKDVNCTDQLEKYVAKESSPFNFDDDKTREAFLRRFRYDGTLPELKPTVKSKSRGTTQDHPVSLPNEAASRGTTQDHPVSLPNEAASRGTTQDHPVSLPNEAAISHQHILENGTVFTHVHTTPLLYSVRNGKIIAKVYPHNHNQSQVTQAAGQVIPRDHKVSVPKEASVNHQHVLATGQVVTHKHLVPLTYYVRNGKVLARVRPHPYTEKSNSRFPHQNNVQDHPVHVPKHTRVIHQHVLPNGSVVTHTHLVPMTYVMRNGKVIARVLSHFHNEPLTVRGVRETVIPHDHPVSLPRQAVISHPHSLPNGTVLTHSHSVPIVYLTRNGNVIARALAHAHTSPSLGGRFGGVTPITSYYNPSTSTTTPYTNVLAPPPTTAWWGTNTRGNARNAISSLYPYRIPVRQLPRLIDNIDIYSKDHRRRLG